MASRNTNIIKIIETNWELWADKWVCRRVEFTSDTIGLKAINPSSNEVDIISPSGYNWISLNGSARNTSSCEALFKSFPSLSKSNFAFLANSFANKRVLSIAIRVTAGFLFIRFFPKIVFTNRTGITFKSQLFKSFNGIKLFWVCCKLRTS